MSVSQQSASCDYWSNPNQQLYNQLRPNIFSDCRQNYYNYNSSYDNTECYREYSCDFQQRINNSEAGDKYKYFGNNFVQDNNVKAEIDESLLNPSFQPCGQPVYNPTAAKIAETVRAEAKSANFKEESSEKAKDSPALRALLSKPLGKKLTYSYENQPYGNPELINKSKDVSEEGANQSITNSTSQQMDCTNSEMQNFYPWMKTTGRSF